MIGYLNEESSAGTVYHASVRAALMRSHAEGSVVGTQYIMPQTGKPWWGPLLKDLLLGRSTSRLFQGNLDKVP